MKKIVLGGPPKSGKSCSREGLKKAIMRIAGAPYPYVITACPDGEGSWFQDAVNMSPERAAEAKAAYKGKFTDDFMRRITKAVAATNEDLVMVDIGGIVSDENRAIVQTCTHAVLIAGDWDGQTWEERLVEWFDFCREMNLTVIGVIYSDYYGSEDSVQGVDEEGVFRGSVHYLERGEDVSVRPMIEALAQHLVELATN